ncbi:hypothetical protein D3C81_2225260 [compost metagenome]
MAEGDLTYADALEVLAVVLGHGSYKSAHRTMRDMRITNLRKERRKKLKEVAHA